MVDKIPGMDDYVQALSLGRLDEAKACLLLALSSARAVNAEPVVAGVVQRFGELCFSQGDNTTAIFLYEISECLDQNSLLVRLDYAKFLAEKIKDKPGAYKKCNEIIEMARNNPFPETDDDFGSQEYLDAALRVQRALG